MRRLWAARRLAVDRQGRRRSGSAGSASRTTSWRIVQRCTRCRRRRPERRLHARPAARHGRLEPRSRSAEDDLRQDRRLPRAARPRLDRPGAGAGVRERGRSRTTRSFIVSSKSGSTLEPNIFKQYFFDRVQRLVGAKEAGSRFIAITDPGSKMQQVAERDGFRHVFFGWPNIGGRYSALSDFGLVPRGHHGRRRGQVPRPDRGDGLRLHAVGSRCRRTPASCSARSSASPRSQFGRDKVTIVASPGIARSRRLAGAAGRRVDRQGRQGTDPDRSRDARRT